MEDKASEFTGSNRLFLLPPPLDTFKMISITWLPEWIEAFKWTRGPLALIIVSFDYSSSTRSSTIKSKTFRFLLDDMPHLASLLYVTREALTKLNNRDVSWKKVQPSCKIKRSRVRFQPNELSLWHYSLLVSTGPENNRHFHMCTFVTPTCFICEIEPSKFQLWIIINMKLRGFGHLILIYKILCIGTLYFYFYFTSFESMRLFFFNK